MIKINKIIIIGVGVGINTLTIEGVNAIKNAQVITGAPRLIKLTSELYKNNIKNIKKQIFNFYKPKDILELINNQESQIENFVVLVSGDVGFYSAATQISKALYKQNKFEIQFIAGISTVNIFFAKLKKSWQDAKFISAHGRNSNIVDTIRRNNLTFCLTGNNIKNIALDLVNNGFGEIKTYIGENLGTEQERVFETLAQDLIKQEFSSLTVLLFENPESNKQTPTGLPDDLFLRVEGVPMTKCEVRAIILSKLRLKPESICWDIGAGTGSVSVEMALSAYNGHVHAIERKQNAFELINKNRERFHIGNITSICAKAPNNLEDLPIPDAVFIGGSGGELQNIIDIILSKNPKARIVISAITLETINLALMAFKNANLEPQITQITSARTRLVGGLHMFEGQNPITIFCV